MLSPNIVKYERNKRLLNLTPEVAEQVPIRKKQKVSQVNIQDEQEQVKR